MAALEATHYSETRTKLAADPAIQAMADELTTHLEKHDATVAQFQHEDGTPRHEFMGSALTEWKRRTRNPIPTHIGGPAEAILTILTGK